MLFAGSMVFFLYHSSNGSNNIKLVDFIGCGWLDLFEFSGLLRPMLLLFSLLLLLPKSFFLLVMLLLQFMQ